jgi:heterodisulfide reductase subunit B
MAIELVRIKDWNCCGASSSHGKDELLAKALSVRNLALAEKEHITTLMVPCSACYSRMFEAAEAMDEDNLKEMNEIIYPLEYKGTVQVKNILEVLWKDIGLSHIIESSVRNLKGLPLVCYYGCYLTRTPGCSSDDRENPVIMEKILRAIGGEPLNWPYKTDCCGAGLSITEEDVSMKLCEKLLDMAVNRGAKAIVTTCPLCHTNLEMGQVRLGKYSLPVFYISDLLGLSMGYNPGRKHWSKHFIDPVKIVKRIMSNEENDTWIKV